MFYINDQDEIIAITPERLAGLCGYSPKGISTVLESISLGLANCPKALKPWVGKVYVILGRSQVAAVNIEVAQHIIEYKASIAGNSHHREAARQALEFIRLHGWGGYVTGTNRIYAEVVKKVDPVAPSGIPKDYVNATQICKDNDKLWWHYIRQANNYKYVQALAEEIGVPKEFLFVQTRDEGSEDLTTWVHPMLGIDLLQWASVDARVDSAKKSRTSSTSSPKQVIVHKWEGHNISQASADFVINGVVIPAGYVNATEMCHACGKQWADYKRQIGVSGYWQALASDMGIPIAELILTIHGRGSGANAIEQATWVHPEISTDLAQWVSYSFRIWANRTLVREMIALKEKANAQQEVLAKLLPSTPKLPERRFDDEFIEATDVLSYSGGWKNQGMSKFLSLAVHRPVVKKLGYQRLNEINPVTRKRGKRDRLQSQHFSEEVDMMFKQRIDTVKAVLMLSTNRSNFWRNLENLDSSCVQMTLGNILD